jgi:hypothetical protein
MNTNQFDPAPGPTTGARGQHAEGQPNAAPASRAGHPVLPPAAPVPDDRIHGDDLPGAEPYGESWLRPTLTSTTDPKQTETGSGPAGLAPGAAPGRPPTRSWLIAGLGATLLLASAASFFSWNAVTGGLWRSVDQAASYPQSISEIAFVGSSGDIEIRADSASGNVELTRHLSWGPGSSQPTPDEQVDGSTLRIGSGCSAFMSWCSIDYVVHVPRGTNVNLNSGSGDVLLAGDLGTTTAETGSGDIALEGSGTGPLSLKAGSGDIDAEGIDAGRVVGHTGSGSMNLDFAEAPSDVALDAGSGDVSVQVPQGIYAVSGDSGSGDREVGVSLSPTSSNRIEIQTGSGDVNLTYR